MTPLESLRQQVQQVRDIHYELACDHSEMAGHEVQEAHEFGRVSAYDEVLALLDEALAKERGSLRE